MTQILHIFRGHYEKRCADNSAIRLIDGLYRLRRSHGHADTCANGRGYVRSYGYGYAYTHSHDYTHANGRGYGCSYGHGYANTYGYATTRADIYTRPHAYRYARAIPVRQRRGGGGAG